ncbi:MAG: hypothetical protein ACREEB_00930, partial [Caulobacteraceae bacterium]
RLLAGSSWVPEPLRTPGGPLTPASEDGSAEAEHPAIAQSASDGGEPAVDAETDETETAPRPAAMLAAE